MSSLEDLGDERFDLITVFDVMEHIPQAERPAFVAGLAARQGRVDGLQLMRYEAYDVAAAAPSYAADGVRGRRRGRPAVLRAGTGRAHPGGRALRRGRASRSRAAAAAGDRASAWWFLTARTPKAES